MIRRFVLFACGILLAAALPAQQPLTGSGRTDAAEGGLGCFCTSILDGGAIQSMCIQDYGCGDPAFPYCDAATPCEPGFVCATNECCEDSPTAGRCTFACPDGPCTNEGDCGPGECRPPLPAQAIPALSTYGSTALAALVTLGGIWLVRRRLRQA